jgi:hypothetical protein
MVLMYLWNERKYIKHHIVIFVVQIKLAVKKEINVGDILLGSGKTFKQQGIWIDFFFLENGTGATSVTEKVCAWQE